MGQVAFVEKRTPPDIMHFENGGFEQIDYTNESAFENFISGTAFHDQSRLKISDQTRDKHVAHSYAIHFFNPARPGLIAYCDVRNCFA